jgi:hypothetical protein
MKRYDIDLSAWLIVYAEDADEAFNIGQGAIADIREFMPEFDGEVSGVTEWEDN